MGLKEGDTKADIGCGIGYFAFPASQIVDKSDRVFAMDISLKRLKANLAYMFLAAAL